VKAQCKDLIGTNSTAVNLANICRQLVLHPERYIPVKGSNARANVLDSINKIKAQKEEDPKENSAQVQKQARVLGSIRSN
jgi:hypothetical protein